MLRVIVVMWMLLFAVKAEGQMFSPGDFMLYDSIFSPQRKLFFLPQSFNLELPSSAEIITVNTVANDLNRTYLVDDRGRTTSHGFAPTRYFRPNHNKLVVKGTGRFSDSFNPYGAINIGEALFLGAINRFITGVGRARRRPDVQVIY